MKASSNPPLSPEHLKYHCSRLKKNDQMGPSGHLSSQELHQIFDGRPDLTHHLQVAKGQHLGPVQSEAVLAVFRLHME